MNPYLTPQTKIYHSWTKDLNIKRQNLQNFRIKSSRLSSCCQERERLSNKTLKVSIFLKKNLKTLKIKMFAHENRIFLGKLKGTSHKPGDYFTEYIMGKE